MWLIIPPLLATQPPSHLYPCEFTPTYFQSFLPDVLYLKILELIALGLKRSRYEYIKYNEFCSISSRVDKVGIEKVKLEISKEISTKKA